MRESSYLTPTPDCLERLRKLPAFAAFPEEHLKLILTMSRIQWYDPGEAIIREGEYGTWMYFVIAGGVAVESMGAAISCLHRAGEVFGEMGVIDGEKRSATVRAETETMLLAVDASFLDRMAGVERAACYAMLNRLFATILSDRLRATTRELADTLRALERRQARTRPSGTPAEGAP